MEEIIFCHNLLYESGNTEKPYQKRNIIIFDRFNLFLYSRYITLPLVAALTSSNESADRGRSIIQVTTQDKFAVQ